MSKEMATVESTTKQLSEVGNLLDVNSYNQMVRVATNLSKSSLVPQNYQNHPEDCLIAVDMANRMAINPLFVMQNLYVVKGKPAWSGQACMALINASGRFKNVRHNYFGKEGTDTRGCFVSADRTDTGEHIEGVKVTMQMAKSEGWTSNAKWRNMPELMLAYRSAAFFARVYCPDMLMGCHTDDEIQDISPETAKEESDENLRLLVEEDSAPTEQYQDDLFVCEDCGAVIQPLGNHSAEYLAKYTEQKYGRPLCSECASKAKNGGTE